MNNGDLKAASLSAYLGIKEITALLGKHKDSYVCSELIEQINNILVDRQPLWATYVIKDHFNPGCELIGGDHDQT